MREPGSWDDFRNILCVRPDNMGDVLMTSPAIRALKNSGKDRKITLLTSGTGSRIAKFIPEIDDIIEFDLPWYKHEADSGALVSDLTEKLREGHFDAAVIFTVYSQNPLPTAMLCYLAGIPSIAGYCRENPYRLMTHWIPDEEPLYKIRHEVTRQIDLVRSLGAEPAQEELSLEVPQGAGEKALAKLRAAGLNTEEPWLIIHG
ncbi:MAG TPA: glycosyltransferase family 9 protein, partial [Anseongella sp.]|nr:glycosyltransferase family 9 protein [Anseongella sp.]